MNLVRLGVCTDIFVVDINFRKQHNSSNCIDNLLKNNIHMGNSNLQKAVILTR